MREVKIEDGDLETLGSVAASALDEIHEAFYGCAPATRCAWTSGTAMLLVLRSQQVVQGGAVSELAPPLGAMQRMVAAAVLRRTGETLRAAGRSSDPSRGLAVLAFEHITGGAPAGALRVVPTPVASNR
jgi:hypothetical protein